MGWGAGSVEGVGAAEAAGAAGAAGGVDEPFEGVPVVAATI